MEKVIVVGTNHAGTHTINILADNYSKDVKVTTYDSNNNISFLGCGMALWIGNVIDTSSGLFYSNPDLLREKGVDVYMEHKVHNIDFDNKTVEVEDLNTGKTIKDTYDKLVIAVGSWPIKPPLPGIDLENIIFAKLYQHAQFAKQVCENKEIRKVGVVGAGYIGVELVEAFKNSGKEVTLIDIDKPLGRYYDDNFSKAMEENLIENGVNVVLGEAVESFEGIDGKVSKIITTKSEYEVDLVLFSVGFNANTRFLQDTKLERNERGVIKVNNKQETNIPGVYAIGDCSQIHNNATDTDEHIALASNAVRTGIVAGHNIGGKELEMQGVQGSNAIHIYGLTMSSTGITESVAKERGFNVDSIQVEELLKPEFMPENDKVTLKIVWDVDTKRILGAQMMSTADISLANHFFSLAIQEKYSIEKLALLDLFFLPHFNQPVNFITKAGILALNK